MLKLFKFLKPYWWQVLLLIMFTGGEVFATLQLPALMADIINKGIVIGDTDYIWKTGLIMVGIATASAGCALASSYFSARVGANFSRDIRAAMYNKVINLNLVDTKEYSTASLINRTTNDVNQVQQVTMMMLSVMLLSPMFCILSLIMAIQTAPDMPWNYRNIPEDVDYSGRDCGDFDFHYYNNGASDAEIQNISKVSR